MHRAALPFGSLLLAGTLAVLGGCATAPLDIGAADRHVTPRAATENVAAVRDRTVAWGGVIVVTKNLKDSTQIEIVSYPLDDSNRPRTDATPTGRFLAMQSGYLETADYAPGRIVTVVGKVTETRTGTVGEAPYVYPVVAATNVHLWPRPRTERPDTTFHFGIGVGIIR
jgi:outer membrane lipoprotein